MQTQIILDTFKCMRTIQGDVIDWLGYQQGLSERLQLGLGSNLPKWSNKDLNLVLS